MLHHKTVLAAIAGVALSVPALAQNTQPTNPPNNPAPHPANPGAPANKPTIAPAVQPQKKDPAQWKEKTATLSPEQQELARTLTGTWNTETTVWTDPSHPPTVSKGTAKFDPILGARFIRQTYEGEMMGQKFSGEGLFCFNTVSKEYESSWIDSSATGIMLSSGHKDANGALVFTGPYDDSTTGQKMMGKTVLRHEGKDKMVFTMSNVGSGGTESKVLEVVYTRATPGGKVAPKPDEKKEEPKKSG